MSRYYQTPAVQQTQQPPAAPPVSAEKLIIRRWLKRLAIKAAAYLFACLLLVSFGMFMEYKQHFFANHFGSQKLAKGGK